MTALNPEATIAEPKLENKLDSNPTQQNVEVISTQKKDDASEQTKSQPKEPESIEDPNWKAFREARKRDRAEKEAAERRAAEKEAEVAALKAAMEAAFTAKSSPSTQAYQQYYGLNQVQESPEESEDQKIERKVNELLYKKEEQYRKQALEEEIREYPKRLMRDFPDFGQVCSQENLDYLDYHYPEISRPLQRLGDGYDKWHDTYHAVKKLIPNFSSARKDAMRAELNSNKPRSISTTGPSHTGEKSRETWQETEARRNARWLEMKRTINGV